MKMWVRHLNYVVNLQKLNSRFYHFTPNRGRLQKSQTQETTEWTTESMRFNRMEPETSEDFYSRLVLQADKCGFHCGDCGSSFQQRMIRDRLMLVVDKYLCTDILTLSDDPSIEEILSKSQEDQKFRTICRVAALFAATWSGLVCQKSPETTTDRALVFGEWTPDTYQLGHAWKVSCYDQWWFIWSLWSPRY